MHKLLVAVTLLTCICSYSSADIIAPLGGITSYFDGSDAGISADGSTVVGSRTPSGIPFRWTQADGMIDLLLPGATWGRARAMSADGNSVVGYCTGFVDPKNQGEAFLWTPADGMVGLGGLINDPVGFFIFE